MPGNLARCAPDRWRFEREARGRRVVTFLSERALIWRGESIRNFEQRLRFAHFYEKWDMRLPEI